MASMTLELQPFPVPNEVVLKMPPMLRQEDWRTTPTMKLADLSDEALAALCDEFTQNVFLAAGKNYDR